MWPAGHGVFSRKMSALLGAQCRGSLGRTSGDEGWLLSLTCYLTLGKFFHFLAPFSHLHNDRWMRFWSHPVLTFFDYNEIKYVMKDNIYWALTACPIGDSCYLCALHELANPYNYPMRGILLISSSQCHHWENWDIESLSKSPKVTQLVSNQSKIWTWTVWL